MKRIIRSVAVIVAALSLFSLFSCLGHDNFIPDIFEKGKDGLGSKAVVNTSGLTYFYYSYNGSIDAGSWSFEVSEEDGAALVKYEGMRYSEYGEMTSTEDIALLKDLEKLYVDNNICQWEGYSKYNPNVLDGDGFSLDLKFADEKGMSASGSNTFPDGYGDFSREMHEIIDPVIDKILEARRQELVEKGVGGKMTSLLAVFKQQGDSGFDSYEFMLYDSSVRDSNFDVTIHSNSGDYIEPGDYRYYSAVSDEAIDFDAVAALVEKYNLITWYDYDVAAEDYSNSEWFQIDFCFEDGHISAMGTEHPENYDEFRNEFLELMMSMIKNAEENHGLKLYE